ncbi:hypothetical protein [Streptomyces tendae]|uniref:AAA family ATPase n=1 Tax=Streptomyces tendae TaxID=1932 RepID=UPI002E2AA247|nr:hypothetical protein [Streptomyces tendae]
MADGDGRYLLNMAEQLQALPDTGTTLDPAALAHHIQQRAPLYDKAQEGHYNLISALHKSMRGSDPDAALYWLARMLDGGEDPLFVARRLVRFANEDIGIADPHAVQQALAAWDGYERLGTPEGELASTTPTPPTASPAPTTSPTAWTARRTTSPPATATKPRSPNAYASGPPCALADNANDRRPVATVYRILAEDEAES